MTDHIIYGGKKLRQLKVITIIPPVFGLMRLETCWIGYAEFPDKGGSLRSALTPSLLMVYRSTSYKILAEEPMKYSYQCFTVVVTTICITYQKLFLLLSMEIISMIWGLGLLD